MMDFVKPQLHANFEVASFSRSRNIKGEPPNFGELPYPRVMPIFYCSLAWAVTEACHLDYYQQQLFKWSFWWGAEGFLWKYTDMG